MSGFCILFVSLVVEAELVFWEIGNSEILFLKRELDKEWKWNTLTVGFNDNLSPNSFLYSSSSLPTEAIYSKCRIRQIEENVKRKYSEDEVFVTTGENIDFEAQFVVHTQFIVKTKGRTFWNLIGWEKEGYRGSNTSTVIACTAISRQRRLKRCILKNRQRKRNRKKNWK